MRPVLFRWRKLTVWSYPAMLYVGLVFGVAAGNIAAHVAGLNALRAYVATLLLLVPALAGARMLHVASKWNVYRHDLRRIWNRREGGLMMYGSVPLMLSFSVPLLRMLHLHFGVFWDVSTFTILVGMMFTRVGCFLNGCCAGRPSKSWLAVYLPNTRGVWQKRIPNQGLEAAAATLLLLSAILIWRRMPFPGALFLTVMMGYSGVRLALEFVREREAKAREFWIAHTVSAALLLTSISVLALNWRR